MRICSCASLLLLAVMLVFCSNANGGAIIVSFGGPGTVAAGGGIGSIDVFVSSTTGADNLDAFSAEFLLTPVGGAPIGGLQFGTQLEAQLVDGTYVHAGNSAGSPIGMVSGANNETYIGGDSTANFLGTALPLHPLNRLLFRLDLTTTTALAGDQYTISLVNDLNTFFLDETFAGLTIDPQSFTNSGTINISLAAVPEPSSVILLTTIFGGCIWRSRRRKTDKSTL